MGMNYAEHIPPPINTETGFLPGLNVGWESFLGKGWVSLAALDFDFGSTRYDGALQDAANTPVVSTTNNVIFDISAAIGRVLHVSLGRLIPYIGVGMHYWHRGLTGTGAYTEKYYFYYLPVGVRLERALSDKFQIAVDVSGFWNLGGRIRVFLSEFDPTLQDVTGTLGSAFGFKLEIPLSYHLNPSLNLVAVPFFETFGIGAGDVFPIHSTSGQQVDSALEPASTTYFYGIRLGVAWIF
jgi:hypothetical protein